MQILGNIINVDLQSQICIFIGHECILMNSGWQCKFLLRPHKQVGVTREAVREFRDASLFCRSLSIIKWQEYFIKTHDRCLLQEIRWWWRWFQNTSFTLSNKQQIFEIPIPLKTVYIYINNNDISDSPWLISCLSISKHNTTTQRHTLSAGTSKTSLLIKEIKKP